MSSGQQNESRFKINATNIIAIASGKGGVGKSTFAVNLAVALRLLGKKVGILDADIYGPSVPRMMGVSGRPEASKNKKLIPLESYGIKCMSIGFLVSVDTPTIWRGPMVMKALEQMFNGVEWGTLDYLIIDLPPGTGDAQLTLAQSSKLSGSIIVSTPQDVALADARKGINMFKRVNVPILGLVENMSYFICDNCNQKHFIFSNDGAKKKLKNLVYLQVQLISLTNRYWPGPLTVILQTKQNNLAKLLSQGKSTIAIRVPSHPVARDLLEQIKIPILAPSANKSGGVSPTEINHVKDDFGPKFKGKKMPEIIFPGPEGRLHGRFHPQKSTDAPIAIIR